jgi:hypothetical protein
LLGVIATACAVPTLRALRIAPMDALRKDSVRKDSDGSPAAAHDPGCVLGKATDIIRVSRRDRKQYWEVVQR